MTNYIIAYRGGARPSTPEEGAQHMERWKAWVANVGDAMVNPGTPIKGATLLGADGVRENNPETAMSGYVVVKADSLDAALEIAKGDPFLSLGGTLEVGEMIEMNMG